MTHPDDLTRPGGRHRRTAPPPLYAPPAAGAAAAPIAGAYVAPAAAAIARRLLAWLRTAGRVRRGYCPVCRRDGVQLDAEGRLGPHTDAGDGTGTNRCPSRGRRPGRRPRG